MQDYEQYRSATGISSLMMVSALKPRFRSITKQILAIVNHPETYGVCLVPEAERLLEKTFGPGPGLAYQSAKRRGTRARRKGHALTVRMGEDLYLRLMSMKTAGEFPTTQALAEALLRESIERGAGRV